MLGFYYLFRHCVRIFLIFLGIVSKHRLYFSALHSAFIIFSGIVFEISSSSSASCSKFPHLPQHCVRASLIFSGIVSRFSSSSSTSCLSISYLFRHRVRHSLSFSTLCIDFPRHRVRASLIFFDIASEFHYLF